MNNKELHFKGLKYAVGAIQLIFLGPAIIYNAFMNKHISIHYIVLVIGIIFCITLVYLLFKGAQIIMSKIPVNYDEAGILLEKHGSVRKAVENFLK